MNLLILAIINPYKAFLKSETNSFTMILLVFILGISFLYFGSNELLKYFNHYSIYFPFEYIKSHNLIISANFQNANFTDKMLFYLITLAISFILVAIVNLFLIITGAFVTDKNISNAYYLKISFIFTYSFLFFFTLLKTTNVLYPYFCENYFFIILFSVLMVFLYCAIYKLFILQAIYKVFILFTSIILFSVLCYGLYLVIFSNSVEHDFQNKINILYKNII